MMLVTHLLCWCGWWGRIDPRGGGQGWRRGGVANEALGMGGVGGMEHLLPGRVDGGGLSVVDDFRGEQAQARVVVLGVVPGKEFPAEGASLLDGREARRKVRPVFEGLALGFGVGVVIGDV